MNIKFMHVDDAGQVYYKDPDGVYHRITAIRSDYNTNPVNPTPLFNESSVDFNEGEFMEFSDDPTFKGSAFLYYQGRSREHLGKTLHGYQYNFKYARKITKIDINGYRLSEADTAELIGKIK